MVERTNRCIAIVTGASSGIGKVTAKALLQQGWRVIGIGRNAERCALAETEIQSQFPDASFELLRANLSLMREAARVADNIFARVSHIDALVNNAGGMAKERSITSEGNEATFAGNHLGHFLLTRKLLPLLRVGSERSGKASVRVISVSSLAHQSCKSMDWDDLQMIKQFNPAAAYCRVKLANILFTRELAKRYASEGLIAHAMHPGTVSTNFIEHADALTQHFIRTRRKDVTVTPVEGADTLIWLATAAEPGRCSGKYFYQRAEAEVSPLALDDAVAARLWVESERLVGAYL